jgi:hypothetical protein
MRARWTLNLLLLLLVALLSTLAQRDLERERRAAILTELDPTAIAEIVMERPGTPDVRLLREGGDWRMESPYRVPAEGGRIAQLVGIAATPVYRSLPQTGAAEGLGLTPARARLSLDGLVLRFGDTDPIDKRRYVAVGGQVHLIDDGFWHHLSAPAEAYVSRRLLPADLVPAVGELDGKTLPDGALAGLAALTAEEVVALEGEISGRLLALSTGEGGRSLRFLLSEDGRRWTRLDLRLTYVLAEPPAWAVAGAAGANEPALNIESKDLLRLQPPEAAQRATGPPPPGGRERRTTVGVTFTVNSMGGRPPPGVCCEPKHPPARRPLQRAGGRRQVGRRPRDPHRRFVLAGTTRSGHQCRDSVTAPAPPPTPPC